MPDPTPVIDALAGRQPACGPTTVVAVDGPSGAGKTDLARAVADATGAALLGVDRFVPGWRGLAEVPQIVADVLGQLCVGGPASARLWDWEADRPGAVETMPSVPLLVLDGCGSGSRAVRPFLSLLVWVDAPPRVRRERAIARDGDTYAPWWDVWAAQERDLFAAEGTQAAADLRLTSG